MSRHFRSLKDGIVSQIQATRKAMGEKDPVAPGTTRGETPRLRIVDQTLRQQRAFQQMNMMESHPWRPQRGLPERSVSVLRAWLGPGLRGSGPGRKWCRRPTCMPDQRSRCRRSRARSRCRRFRGRSRC
ncbi:hypothetical protein ACFX2I_023313 [Malus domestica]